MKIVYENVSDRLQTILSRLKGVKKVGPNTYRAYSPLRDEKEPSLYITEKPDGTILMCDHGGGDTKAILAAIGLTMRILFPDGGSSGSEPKGSQFVKKLHHQAAQQPSAASKIQKYPPKACKQRRFHAQFASFFRFMAANLSLTHCVTRARPLMWV